MAYTAGPWEFDGSWCEGLAPPAVMSGDIQLAHALIGSDLNGRRIDAEQAHANARLIAASPELLTACIAAYGTICRRLPEMADGSIVADLRAAIAKATSTPPPPMTESEMIDEARDRR